jgi:ABC-type multidrug transport system ATPase subunit
MAKTAKLKGEELNFIDRILHSMFGNDIPLYKLEQARSQVLSIRTAASFLNQHLSTADRSKILLNLVTLAYHERSKINVLGSLEIVELTDLLRLEVSSLDAVYDLMEGKTDTIDLPALAVSGSESYLRNSMVWAPNGADFKFIGRSGTCKFVFIMIEALVLFYSEACNETEPCRIQRGDAELTLDSGKFHRLKEDSMIILPGAAGDIRLRTMDLWHIYNLGTKAIEFLCPDTGIRLQYRKHKFYLNSKNKYVPNKELALDEVPLPTCPGSVLQLLTRDHSNTELLKQTRDYYLCRDKQGLFVEAEPSQSALMHFYYENDQLLANNLSDGSLFVNRLPVKTAIPFSLNQDIISIGDANYLVNRHWELIEIPIQISELSVQEVSHTFKGGKTALSNIFFRVPKGSMMAIMGPSGSGKTTLLQVLLGDIKATHSRISIDGMDFESNFSFFQKYIGYVPQDDLLFPNLSVFENLHYRIKLALPNLKNKSEIRTRIENLLHSVGLFEQRHMIVGDVMNKKLSGGQRRRLNIALELVLNPVIIILDEPTSGLSSKDSENIAEFLSELKEQNKIILCTIHQPNATVFKAFDRILLLDKGGCQVYFGDSTEVFDYFDEELQQSGKRREFLQTKRSLQMPDYFYDLIETPDWGYNRRFPPDYWEQKFRDHSFRKALEMGQEPEKHSEPQYKGKTSRYRFSFNPRNLILLTSRNFLNKLRSKINLIMTLLVAPLLAALTAFVLRGVPDGKPYSFLSNQNALLFGFISIIIFIFIGLANSIDDLLGEKRSIQRELKLNISANCQLLSKHAVLFVMTVVQVVLYYFISALVLGMRGYFLPQSIFLLLSGIVGYSMGLLFSSIIRDRSAIVNILPLVIIPQIMFSGAVIRFAEMNTSLRINRKSEIPEFCHTVPSRWLFEGWAVASTRLNVTEREKKSFLDSAKDTSRSYEQYMTDVNAYNRFLETHPDTNYSNELIQTSVKLAHGDYLNQGCNIFLSHRVMVLSKEMDTIKLDIIVSMLMILLLSVFTLLRLLYGFR